MQRQFYDCEFFCFGLSFCDVCGLRKRVAAFSRRSMSQHWGRQSVPSLARCCRVPEESLTPFMGQAQGPGALDAIKRNASRLAACKTLASKKAARIAQDAAAALDTVTALSKGSADCYNTPRAGRSESGERKARNWPFKANARGRTLRKETRSARRKRQRATQKSARATQTTQKTQLTWPTAPPP
jgi:hypothetical protein